MDTKKAKVLILGGGFAGLYAAIELDKAPAPGVEVILVNRERDPTLLVLSHSGATEHG